MPTRRRTSPSSASRFAGERYAEQLDPAAVGGLQAARELEQHALARRGGADEPEPRATRDVERHAVEHDQAAVALVDVVEA